RGINQHARGTRRAAAHCRSSLSACRTPARGGRRLQFGRVRPREANRARKVGGLRAGSGDRRTASGEDRQPAIKQSGRPGRLNVPTGLTRPEWFKSMVEADTKITTAPALPWSTPTVTHEAVAQFATAVLQGEGGLRAAAAVVQSATAVLQG